jgi:predicted component of type VI protein secretion system
MAMAPACWDDGTLEAHTEQEEGGAEEGMPVPACRDGGTSEADSEQEEVSKTSTLGQEYLGIDTIIGSSWFNYEPGYLVNIGPLSHSDLEELMPGCPAQKALNVFCEYFFPVGARLKFNYFMLSTQNTINLATGNTTGQGLARLGLSSYL